MQKASKFPGTSNAVRSQPSTSSFVGHLVVARNSPLASTSCSARRSTALIAALASTSCSVQRSNAVIADFFFGPPFFLFGAPFLVDLFLLVLMVPTLSLCH